VSGVAVELSTGNGAVRRIIVRGNAGEKLGREFLRICIYSYVFAASVVTEVPVPTLSHWRKDRSSN
jgi:hypothetical protein